MITQTKPLRFLLVDDAPAVRQSLRWLLEETPGFAVVGEATDGLTALIRCRELLPDIVLLDIDLPQKNGFRVAYQLKRQHPAIRVIFLSGHADEPTRRLARQVGGDGFVEKSEGWKALLVQIGHLPPTQNF